MSMNETLKEFIDLTGNVEMVHLLKSKQAMKVRENNLKTEQSQIDARIKELVGDHANFVCGDIGGTYKFEHRAERIQRETNPRVLRIS